MAKQTGIFGVKGKLNGTSFYQSKNGGNLIKSLPINFGERVKTEPAFENTRKNASEFGVAASFAGNLVKVVAQRWRYILKSSIVGEMSKTCLSLLRMDTVHPWGERVIKGEYIHDVISKYNTYSKNQMPADWRVFMDNMITIAQGLPEYMVVTLDNPLQTTARMEQEWMMKGATHVAAVMVGFSFTTEEPVGSRPTFTTQDISSGLTFAPLTGAGGAELVSDGAKSLPGIQMYHTDNNQVAGVALVALPAKSAGPNNNYAVLQSLCSAYLMNQPY